MSATIDTAEIARTIAAATTGHHIPGVVAGITTDTETVFLDASGVRGIDVGGAGDEQPMTVDTVFAIFSTTKAITATLALQLAESGLIDLDGPARDYLPIIGDIEVIDGFDDVGRPLLRPPATDLTTRQLLTHTSGFGYDFYNENYRRLADENGIPDTATATRASIGYPLLFDPGTRWEYGVGLDWTGLLIEEVTGQRLGEAMAERVLRPLGMSDTAFTLSADTAARRATMHLRRLDGSLKPLPGWSLPADPEVQMGGAGLYSTVGDYLKFIRMWCNDGRADSGEQVLRPETIAMAARNQIGELSVTPQHSNKATVSHDAEFFPGVAKSWAVSFLINDADAPTGRPAGSLGWGGLANLYYWIDRHNRIGGYWASQILPYADPTALAAYYDFEAATYRALR